MSESSEHYEFKLAIKHAIENASTLNRGDEGLKERILSDGSAFLPFEIDWAIESAWRLKRTSLLPHLRRRLIVEPSPDATREETWNRQRSIPLYEETLLAIHRLGGELQSHELHRLAELGLAGNPIELLQRLKSSAEK
jgi:hypothetical protein